MSKIAKNMQDILISHVDINIVIQAYKVGGENS
jgi:hypothetical protein